MSTTITTRAELIAVVKDYLIESALIDSSGADITPLFIQLAEFEFNRRLLCREMEDRVEKTTSSTSPEIVGLPNDFLMASLIISSGTSRNILRKMSLDQLEYRYSNTTGTPLHYAMYNNQIRLAPIPTEETTIQVYYYKKITPITSSTTNWLFDTYPELYLYGTLVQAAKYAKNEAEVVDWLNITSATINSINALSDQSKRGNGAYKLQIR